MFTSLVSSTLEVTSQVATPEPLDWLQFTELPIPETLSVGVTPLMGLPCQSVKVIETTATSLPLARIGPLTARTAFGRGVGEGIGVGVEDRAFPLKSEKRPGQTRPQPVWVKNKIAMPIQSPLLKMRTHSYNN